MHAAACHTAIEIYEIYCSARRKTTESLRPLAVKRPITAKRLRQHNIVYHYNFIAQNKVSILYRFIKMTPHTCVVYTSSDPLQIRDRLSEFRDLRLLVIIANRANPPILSYYWPNSKATTWSVFHRGFYDDNLMLLDFNILNAHKYAQCCGTNGRTLTSLI